MILPRAADVATEAYDMVFPRQYTSSRYVFYLFIMHGAS